MVVAADPTLTGPRWSSAVMCPRKAFYEAQNAPRRDWTPEELQRFRRGKVWEEAVVSDVVAQFHEQGRRPRRQETVAWPAGDPVGTGHIDCFIPSERTVIEVVSNAGGTLPEYKVLQAAGYALNHKNADKAFVLSVDTHTGDDPVYPIDLDGVEPRIRAIETAVVDGIRSGEEPERVCQTPLDGPAQFCPFVDHCFDGWEWPSLEELLADRAELDALADATDDVGRIRQELAKAEAVRDEYREKLRPLLPAGEEFLVGSYRVKRTTFERSTFSLADAHKCGVNLPKRFAPFVKTSEQERWTVRRLDP